MLNIKSLSKIFVVCIMIVGSVSSAITPSRTLNWYQDTIRADSIEVRNVDVQKDINLGQNQYYYPYVRFYRAGKLVGQLHAIIGGLELSPYGNVWIDTLGNLTMTSSADISTDSIKARTLKTTGGINASSVTAYETYQNRTKFINPSGDTSKGIFILGSSNQVVISTNHGLPIIIDSTSQNGLWFSGDSIKSLLRFIAPNLRVADTANIRIGQLGTLTTTGNITTGSGDIITDSLFSRIGKFDSISIVKLNLDSLKVRAIAFTKANGDSIRLTGRVGADSLYTTNGIRVTRITTTGNITTGSGDIITDSIAGRKVVLSTRIDAPTIAASAGVVSTGYIVGSTVSAMAGMSTDTIRSRIYHGDSIRINTLIASDSIYARAFYGSKYQGDSVCAGTKLSAGNQLSTEYIRINKDSIKLVDPTSNVITANNDLKLSSQTLSIDASGGVGVSGDISTSTYDITTDSVTARVLKSGSMNITSKISADSIYSRTAKFDSIQSPLYMGNTTIRGNIYNGSYTVSTGNVSSDSIYTRTIRTTGDINTGSGDVVTDYVGANRINAAQYATLDSIYGRTIVSSGTQRSDSVNTRAGRFTGTLHTTVSLGVGTSTPREDVEIKSLNGSSADLLLSESDTVGWRLRNDQTAGNPFRLSYTKNFSTYNDKIVVDTNGLMTVADINSDSVYSRISKSANYLTPNKYQTTGTGYDWYWNASSSDYHLKDNLNNLYPIVVKPAATASLLISGDSVKAGNGKLKADTLRVSNYTVTDSIQGRAGRFTYLTANTRLIADSIWSRAIQSPDIKTNTSAFNGVLSATNTNMQSAFDTLDNHIHDNRYFTETELTNYGQTLRPLNTVMGTNVRWHFTDVLTYYNNSGSNGAHTGTIKITMPVSWISKFLTIRIVGYNYSSTGAWEALLGGYPYLSSTRWYNTSFSANGQTPFTSVRFGHDGTKCCILLGTTSTNWNFSQFTIADVFESSSGSSPDALETGWSASLITDETGITVTGTNNYPDITSHIHDTRYFTETELTTKLVTDSVNARTIKTTGDITTGTGDIVTDYVGMNRFNVAQYGTFDSLYGRAFSLTGTSRADSIYTTNGISTKKLTVGSYRGVIIDDSNLDFGSSSSTVKSTGLTLNSNGQAMDFRSATAYTFYDGNINTGSRDIITDSIAARVGVYSGTVFADSVRSTRGISATKGAFSSVVNVDSLKSTKGISATTGNFSGGISSTSGNFTTALSADSVYSTKGISATIGNLSSVLKTDSITSYSKDIVVAKNNNATTARTTFSSSRMSILGDSTIMTYGATWDLDTNTILPGIELKSRKLKTDEETIGASPMLYFTPGVNNSGTKSRPGAVIVANTLNKVNEKTNTDLYFYTDNYSSTGLLRPLSLFSQGWVFLGPYSPPTGYGYFTEVADTTKAHYYTYAKTGIRTGWVIADSAIRHPLKCSELHCHDVSSGESVPTGTTYTQLRSFTDSLSSTPHYKQTARASTDNIQVGLPGKYRVSFSVSGLSGTANVLFKIAAFRGTTELENVHAQAKFGTSGDSQNMFASGIVTITPPDTMISLRIRHTSGSSVTFTPEYANLNVEYVGD